jgi:hypothetical protein
MNTTLTLPNETWRSVRGAVVSRLTGQDDTTAEDREEIQRLEDFLEAVYPVPDP